MKMKKRFLVLLLVLAGTLVLGGCDWLFDDEGDDPQQIAAGAEVVTVSGLASLPKKATVVMTGYIAQSLGGKKYTFRDATGEITVEIEKKAWQGLTFDPSELVDITAKVEQGKKGKIEVEVKSVRKAEEGTGTGVQSYYTVDFVILGVPAIPQAQTVKHGEKAIEPVVRDAANNPLSVIWHTDTSFSTPYSFDLPVTVNITLYGQW